MFDSRKKDAAFFDAFSAHAGKSVEAAKQLHQMMQQLKVDAARIVYAAASTPDPAVAESIKKLAAAISASEHAGHTITHETIKRLRETWITPLDRNDIHGLISCMDDVLDCIEAAGERVLLFQVGAAPAQASALTELLVRACEVCAQAIDMLQKLSQSPKILEFCVEINRIENASDVLYRQALGELFAPGNDPLTVMKWRDIFDNLESAVDRCEDVANIIEGIVLEYA